MDVSDRSRVTFRRLAIPDKPENDTKCIAPGYVRCVLRVCTTMCVSKKPGYLVRLCLLPGVLAPLQGLHGLGQVGSESCHYPKYSLSPVHVVPTRTSHLSIFIHSHHVCAACISLSVSTDTAPEASSSVSSTSSACTYFPISPPTPSLQSLHLPFAAKISERCIVSSPSSSSLHTTMFDASSDLRRSARLTPEVHRLMPDTLPPAAHTSLYALRRLAQLDLYIPHTQCSMLSDKPLDPSTPQSYTQTASSPFEDI